MSKTTSRFYRRVAVRAGNVFWAAWGAVAGAFIVVLSNAVFETHKWGDRVAALLFVALLFVVAGVAIRSSGLVLFTWIPHERIRTVANIASAGAALAIPVVIAIAGHNIQLATVRQTKEAEERRHRQTRETETLRIMNEVDVRISDIVAIKARLDNERKGEKEWPKGKEFSYDYLKDKKNTDVYNEVRKLLNAYEFVCVGVNKGLLELDVVKKMRMDALVFTFRVDYRKYINQIHKEYKNTDTWSDCIQLAKRLEPDVAKRSRTLADELRKLEEEEKRDQAEATKKKLEATK
jgi:hypothetical protein